MQKENKSTVSRKSRLLYVTTTLREDWKGGEPVIARDTIEGLKNLGYEVVTAYYSSKLGKIFTKVIGSIRSIYDLSDSFILSYLYYKKLIKKINPDLIIAQYDYDSSIIKAATKMQKKIIVYTHIWWPICPKIDLFTWNNKICKGYLFNQCSKCIEKSIFKGSFMYNFWSKIPNYFKKLIILDNMIYIKMKNRTNLLNSNNTIIIVLSKEMMKKFVNNGIMPEKIKIIPNGISCNEFNCIDAYKKEKIVGYYGGQSEAKGYQIFFQLAKIIKSLYQDVRFIAAGSFNTKSEYIEFVGQLHRNEVKSLMASSRVTVVPSIWDEPFGLVAIESLATCTPVVTFDTGIFKEIVEDGVTGFVVPYNDINSMADKIIRILTDDVFFSELSGNARKKVCEKFNESRRISLLSEIIEKNV